MRGVPIPCDLQIWRQAKGKAAELIVSLDNQRDVREAIETLAQLEKSEQDRGATTMPHPESMATGSVGGFTCSTQQQVIVTNDGSGKERLGWAQVPSVHYWVEVVLPEQCEIENKRYARDARYARNIGA